MNNQLFHSEQIRAIEHQLSQAPGSIDSVLMEKAGAAVFNQVQQRFSDVHCLAVFCGTGNNGGDGLVFARLAHHAGYQVLVYLLGDSKQMSGPAAQALHAAQAAGLALLAFVGEIPSHCELIIDAIMGIGLTKPLTGVYAQAVECINQSLRPVIAIDIPSGLHPDTGRILGCAIKADLTLTFIAAKLGLRLADAADVCGEIIVDELNLSEYVARFKPAAKCLDASDFCNVLPSRPNNSHKAMNGHVLIIGGGPGMPGAAFLAANASLRVGAGAVTVAMAPGYVDTMLPALPEAMLCDLEDHHALDQALARSTVIAIGPGLIDNPMTRQLLEKILEVNKPCVIDAGALRALSQQPLANERWILTPHPGEAAALLHTQVNKIQDDRFSAIQELQQQYGGCVILKGAGTLIATDEGEIYLSPLGNPGMAVAGMGDVLTGVVAGLVAQGLPLSDAALLGVWVHGYAGDLAIKNDGPRGLVASDLMPFIRHIVNHLG